MILLVKQVLIGLGLCKQDRGVQMGKDGNVKQESWGELGCVFRHVVRSGCRGE